MVVIAAISHVLTYEYKIISVSVRKGRFTPPSVAADVGDTVEVSSQTPDDAFVCPLALHIQVVSSIVALGSNRGRRD